MSSFVYVPKGGAKYFLGGLARVTTSENLRRYFEQYGTVTAAVVILNPDQTSRGFGFVIFQDNDEAFASGFRAGLHWIDGKDVDIKPAVDHEQLASARGSRLFVGGLSLNTSKDALAAHFSQFGKVTDALILRDDNACSRGFGFVAFETPEEADRAAEAGTHVIEERVVDVKKALPRLGGTVAQQARLKNITPVVRPPTPTSIGASSANFRGGERPIGGTSQQAATSSGAPAPSTTTTTTTTTTHGFKCFVNGLNSNVTESKIRQYFSGWGTVITVDIFRSGDSPTACAFVALAEEASADKVSAAGQHYIDGQLVEVTLPSKPKVTHTQQQPPHTPQQVDLPAGIAGSMNYHTLASAPQLTIPAGAISNLSSKHSSSAPNVQQPGPSTPSNWCNQLDMEMMASMSNNLYSISHGPMTHPDSHDPTTNSPTSPTPPTQQSAPTPAHPIQTVIYPAGTEPSQVPAGYMLVPINLPTQSPTTNVPPPPQQVGGHVATGQQQQQRGGRDGQTPTGINQHPMGMPTTQHMAPTATTPGAPQQQQLQGATSSTPNGSTVMGYPNINQSMPNLLGGLQLPPGIVSNPGTNHLTRSAPELRKIQSLNFNQPSPLSVPPRPVSPPRERADRDVSLLPRDSKPKKPYNLTPQPSMMPKNLNTNNLPKPNLHTSAPNLFAGLNPLLDPAHAQFLNSCNNINANKPQMKKPGKFQPPQPPPVPQTAAPAKEEELSPLLAMLTDIDINKNNTSTTGDNIPLSAPNKENELLQGLLGM